MKEDIDCKVEGNQVNCKVPLEHLIDSATKRKTSYEFHINLAVGVVGGYIGWAFLWFVIGLIVYGDMDMAIMLGLFAASTCVVVALFMIPFACIVLFVMVNFFWGWGSTIVGALNLPLDATTGFVWWFSAILGLIGGIIFTILIILFIIKFVND